MDTQTRHALKSNSLVDATASSVNWLSGHRSGALRWVIVALLVLVAGVGSLIWHNVRSSAADAALDAALDAYNAPLAQPGAPAADGEYATAHDRSVAANQKFVAVAQQYGLLAEGAKAHYFAGVTYADLDQNPQAETELKIAAGSWNRDLANLANLALAGLYQQTNRNDDAIKIYKELAAKPSATVPATMAQLDLASLYAASGNQEEARTLWAKVKDADKNGAAGEIAAQKLGGPQ